MLVLREDASRLGCTDGHTDKGHYRLSHPHGDQASASASSRLDLGAYGVNRGGKRKLLAPMVARAWLER